VSSPGHRVRAHEHHQRVVLDPAKRGAQRHVIGCGPDRQQRKLSTSRPAACNASVSCRDCPAGRVTTTVGRGIAGSSSRSGGGVRGKRGQHAVRAWASRSPATAVPIASASATVATGPVAWART
jgi:hypothetical protein